VPSRKQRRRRLKERRHDYEYVYVDDEGHEVEVPEDAQQQAPTRAGGKAASGSRAGATTRAGRRIEPPSWSRVGKRALFIGPVMFLLINLLGKNLSTAQRIYETVVLLAIFLPFSYFMDSLMYRSYLKRTGAAPPSRRRGSNGAA
jgi:hypothetical protein